METVPLLSTETERIVAPSKVMLTVALAPKPDPVRLTLVPGGPLDVLRVRDELTAKLFEVALSMFMK